MTVGRRLAGRVPSWAVPTVMLAPFRVTPFVAAGYSIAVGRPARGFRGVDPLVLTRALRLIHDDPAEVTRAPDAEAAVDEALAAAWHANPSGPWAKHTDPY